MTADSTPVASRWSAPRVALAIVLAAAVALRAVRLFAPGFDGDEPFEILARTAILDRGVPVLPSGVLWIYGAPLQYVGALGTAIGGMDVFWSRLPFFVLGCAAIWVVARTAGRVFGPWGAVAAAAVMAFEPGHVLWTTNVKVYGALTLVTALAIDAWVGWTHEGRERAAWTAAAWTAVAVATHAAVAFLLPGLAAGGAILAGRRFFRLRTLAVAAIGLAAFGAVFAAMRLGDPGFTERSGIVTAEGGAWRWLVGRVYHLRHAVASHGWNSAWHAVPFCVAAAGAILAALRRSRPPAAFFAAWCVTLAGYSTFAAMQPAQYLLPALPLLALAVAGAFTTLAAAVPASARTAVVATAAIALGGAHAWSVRPAWGEAFERHEESAALYARFAADVRPGDVSLGGGPHAWLHSRRAVTDHAVFGGDLGGGVFVRDGRAFDRYFGTAVLGTVDRIRPVVDAAPRAWYFVTDKDLTTGRVLPEVHAWLTSRMELFGKAPGLRLYATPRR